MIKSGSMGLPHVRTSRLCGSAPLTANLSWPWGLAGRYLLSSLCVAVLHVLRESVGCLGNLITGALTLNTPPPKKVLLESRNQIEKPCLGFQGRVTAEETAAGLDKARASLTPSLS